MINLQERYEEICGDYILLFSVKHKLNFSGWADNIGGFADFDGQYLFSLQDIIYDINTNQPKYLITQWQDDMICENITEKICNFQSYSKGYRPK
jgi:hypothetical protein